MSIQTTNSLSVRRSIKRSRKIAETAISENASDSISDSVIVQSFESFAKSAIQLSFEKSMTQNAFDFMNVEEKCIYDSSDSEDETFEFESDIEISSIIQSVTRQSTRQKTAHYLNVFVLKRKRSESIDEEEIVEHRDKIARAMTTLLTQKFINDDTDE